MILRHRNDDVSSSVSVTDFLEVYWFRVLPWYVSFPSPSSQPDGLGFWWPPACAPVMRVEHQVPILVCMFPLHLIVEASVFFSVYSHTVQEGQTVSSEFFPCEPSTVFIFSVKPSTPLVLILTQVSSTYPNRWLGAVPVKFMKALLAISSI